MEMTTRMIRIHKKLALAVSLTAIVAGLGTGIAFAAGDTDDNISPANTSITANNSTNITFKGTINGISVTVTCTTSSISGTTPSSGLGPVNVNNPSFTGCRDTFGGTDTVTTNSTNGHWQLTFIDSTATNEETQAEPNSGDKLQITIPKAGATFKSSILPGCTITAAPSGSASITGTYDDVSTLTISSASIPVSGSGCTASTSSMSGSYKSTPGFHDAS